MSLLSFCGKVAVGVSCLIVIAFVILILLAVFCVGLGAYASVHKPTCSSGRPANLPECFRQNQYRGRRDPRCGLQYYREIK